MIRKKYTINPMVNKKPMGLKIVIDSDVRYSAHEQLVKNIVWTLLEVGYATVEVKSW